MSADVTEPLVVSARTVIDGCFSADGVAELSTVYDVGLAAGIPEQTVRLAIRRLEASGALRQVGRGRAGRLERTGTGAARTRSEADMLAFAFAQDDGEAPWDRRWRIYAFTVPESQRAERDILRAELVRLGAAPLAPGVYVSPHDLRGALAGSVPADVLAQRLLTMPTDQLEVPGCADDREVAERFWPAAATLAAYAPLTVVLADAPSEDPARDGDPIRVAARAMLLAEGLDRALAADPLLPPELRPIPWEPARVRADFRAAWTELAARAPGLPVFRAYEV